MSAFVTAGAGFLLAVLWFDLMFDVQVLSHRDQTLPEPVLASIAGYYARVTTAARPMNQLVASAMIATLTAIVVEIAAGNQEAWVGWVSLALALGAIVRAATNTVPNAVRLGTREAEPARESALARSICHDHLLCAAAIAALLALQLALA